MRVKAEEILKNGGLISQNLSHYEQRSEQIQMAKAVEEGISRKKYLVVEAGTGVGKSLAYLVPFIYWTVQEKKRVVISTYTKTLQEQLIKKDLPFLKKALGIDFHFALALGGENYLCLRKMEGARLYELLDTPGEIRELEKIFSRLPDLKEGLKLELGFEPSSRVWEKICRESEVCLNKRCPFQKRCYYLRAKIKETHSQILVVNHHLFFAHLSSEEKVLPPFNAVVFDEAHNLEEVATSFLGVKVSNYQVNNFLDSLFNPRTHKGFLTRINNLNTEKQVNKIRKFSESFFSNLQKKVGEEKKLRIKEKEFLPCGLYNLFLELSIFLESLKERAKDEEERLEILSYLARCHKIEDNLKMILKQERDDYIYWIEVAPAKRKNKCSLCAAPVDISKELKKRVFNEVKPIILTSATLTIRRNFNYFKERIGLDNAKELYLASPFNYREQVLLYLSPHMPDPWRDSLLYSSRVVEEVEKILYIMKGSTFVLFTSFKMLNQVYEELDKRFLGLNFLKQGDKPRYQLLERFKKGKEMVLFGTNTFWQGVDVPGKALRCVIITKLPFSVPHEPIVEARLEFLKAHNKNPFLCYQLPQAIILLKQGFGRLVRSKEDRGVVAILDPRLRTRDYGKIFLESLPPTRITSTLDEVEEFIRSYL
ncbi:DEAD/DEAH box helicase [Candidatus Aerophobetes bacterium]|nr:DEAD/DEAH box helicase [Candidatus Aerophobetes bacterium]